MSPETWVLVLHRWELGQLPHFIDCLKLCPICFFPSVEKGSGGPREEGLVLALARRVAFIPGARREREVASALA